MNSPAMSRIAQWSPVTESLAEHAIDKGQLLFRSKPVQFEYLAKSATARLGFGTYLLDYEVSLSRGGITVGVMDASMSRWLWSNNHRDSGHGRLAFSVPLAGQTMRVVVSACNAEPATETAGAILRVSVQREVALLGHVAARLKQRRAGIVRWWRTRFVPALYGLRVDLMQMLGRCYQSTLGSLIHKRLGVYFVVDSEAGGYATRSIVCLAQAGQTPLVITADTGDDTLSVFAVEARRLAPRQVVRLPRRSAPISLSVIASDAGRLGVAVGLFNFDVELKERRETLLGAIPDFSRFRRGGAIEDASSELTVLQQRDGCCGFRGSAIRQDGRGGYLLAAADRDGNRVHMLRGSLSDRYRVESEACVDLGKETEPVGISMIATRANSNKDMLYLSCRVASDLIVVGPAEGMGWKVVQRFPINGLSRSSVAAGAFRVRGETEIAVASWGGDPRDLNATGIGELVVCRLDAHGMIAASERITAGMNPTDVVAGDFDGDGLDEIAVLNYGNGLGPGDRQHTGGVQIFKFVGNRLQCVATIAVPNPRIGAAIDIDGDGVPELVASLFFERRIVVIKCF